MFKQHDIRSQSVSADHVHRYLRENIFACVLSPEYARRIADGQLEQHAYDLSAETPEGVVSS